MSLAALMPKAPSRMDRRRIRVRDPAETSIRKDDLMVTDDQVTLGTDALIRVVEDCCGKSISEWLMPPRELARAVLVGALTREDPVIDRQVQLSQRDIESGEVVEFKPSCEKGPSTL